MIRIFLFTALIILGLHAVEIPTAKATKRAFFQNVKLNAQIIQLPNAKQSIMSQVSGHIEKYFIKAGQKVKKGQKVVLIESITISKMTSEYISQKKQLIAQEKNYEATLALYKKGMTSLQALNRESITKDGLLAKLNALKSQLSTLGIKTSKLKRASADFIVYAHSDGIVSKISLPTHSSVSQNTQIISLLKDKAYYLKSFLPLEYAPKIKIGQKIVMHENGKNIISQITQILPNVDATTQRIVLLSSIDKKAQNLFINAYTSATLYFGASKSFISIKKSALSFFDNEWVVFIPIDAQGDEIPYEVRVVEPVIADESFVGVKGLDEGEEYVSDKSYYVKSMLLKSSMGDGD